MGRTLPAAALIKKDYMIVAWIEKTTMVRVNASAGPAVQKNNGTPFWIPGLFVVDLMKGRNFEAARLKGFDFRKELPGLIGHLLPHFMNRSGPKLLLFQQGNKTCLGGNIITALKVGNSESVLSL